MELEKRIKTGSLTIGELSDMLENNIVPDNQIIEAISIIGEAYELEEIQEESIRIFSQQNFKG